MSKHLIEHSTLVGIADAVREQEGTTAPIPVTELRDRIHTHAAEISELLDEINGETDQ